MVFRFQTTKKKQIKYEQLQVLVELNIFMIKLFFFIYFFTQSLLHVRKNLDE